MKFSLFTLFALLGLVLVTYGAAQAAQPANQDEIFQQLDGAIRRAFMVFVWISWAVTLWLLALMAVTFVPKVKGQSRQPQATADGALMPAK